MNVFQYVFIFLFSSAVSFTTLVVALLQIDPTRASTPSFFIFYLALFFFLATFFTTLSTAFRSLRASTLQIEDQIQISLRQSCVLATLIVLCALLMSFDSLAWWMIVLAISFFGIMEYFALAGIEKDQD